MARTNATKGLASDQYASIHLEQKYGRSEHFKGQFWWPSPRLGDQVGADMVRAGSSLALIIINNESIRLTFFSLSSPTQASDDGMSRSVPRLTAIEFSASGFRTPNCALAMESQ